jgi:hypothetical protein
MTAQPSPSGGTTTQPNPSAGTTAQPDSSGGTTTRPGHQAVRSRVLPAPGPSGGTVTGFTCAESTGPTCAGSRRAAPWAARSHRALSRDCGMASVSLTQTPDRSRSGGRRRGGPDPGCQLMPSGGGVRNPLSIRHRGRCCCHVSWWHFNFLQGEPAGGGEWHNSAPRPAGGRRIVTRRDVGVNVFHPGEGARVLMPSRALSQSRDCPYPAILHTALSGVALGSLSDVLCRS